MAGRRASLALALAVVGLGAATGTAGAETISENARFTASDGVTLQTTVSGEAPLGARPTVVEFSPYGRGSATVDPGPAYNFLLVQIRGTGDSDGRFDALGPRTQRDVAEVLLSAGPASLELRLGSTAPETGIWAVLSDVAPGGSAHPVATGRLSTAFPEIDRGRSLRRRGTIVQPYGVFDRRTPAMPGEERLYRVELWPIGNRFRAGHRLRLDILGASAFSMPGAPALNTVRVGAGSSSRLLLPVLAGSRLGEALP